MKDFSDYPLSAGGWLASNANLAKIQHRDVVLTSAQAIELFTAFANLWDMGWGFVRTSCYLKAYLKCEMALAAGLKPEKAWIFPTDKLLVGHHPTGGEFSWDYHVGLALPVAMPDGKIEKLIFDPSLFDSPVSLSEWVSKIGGVDDKSGIYPYDASPPAILSGGIACDASHSPDKTEKALQRLEYWWRNEPSCVRQVFEGNTLPSEAKAPLLILRQGWESVKSAPPPSFGEYEQPVRNDVMKALPMVLSKQ